MKYECHFDTVHDKYDHFDAQNFEESVFKNIEEHWSHDDYLILSPGFRNFQKCSVTFEMILK